MVPDPADTIVAIGTATGGSARGMIRVSGPEAVDVVARCFRAPHCELCTILSPQAVSGELILGDAVPSLPCDLFLWPGENSYTRQPSAELHTVGSSPLLDLAVANLCRHGARLAEPGEFTLRAFLAGRIDLPQAEAVLGVIDAKSDQSLQIALRQLAGGLSQPLNDLREQFLVLLAHLEAGLDFVEDDIEFISKAEIKRQLEEAQQLIAGVLDQLGTRGQSHVLPRVVLAGHPNAGKSSLFNALVRNYPASAEQDQALVSEIAGTTRDYLSAKIELNGIACELVDTAGVDAAETLGIPGMAQEMTTGQLRHANCTMWCVDVTSPSIDQEIADFAGNESNLLIITKCDLRPGNTSPAIGRQAIRCSSQTGEGLKDLATAVGAILGREDAAAVVAATAARCTESLRRAQESLHSALTLVSESGGEELIAAEIRTTLEELGQVLGAVYTDDILDRIFSTFCIGK